MKDILRLAGLDDEESVIYLHILQSGPTSQADVSSSTGLLRQTVYDRVHKLTKRGFLSEVQSGKKTLFAAASPKRLLEKVESDAQELQTALPKLLKLQNTSQSISAQSFEDVQTLRLLFQSTLDSDEILWMCNKELNDQIMQGHFWHNYAAKRIEKGIPIKLIIEPIKDTDWNTDKTVHRETRRSQFMSRSLVSIVIFGDSVLTYSLSGQSCSGTITTNMNIAEFHRQQFQQHWNSAKRT